MQLDPRHSMSAGLGLRSNRPLIAVERRAALLPAWTAATIVAGVTALGFVTVFGTLAGPIAVPMVAEAWARPVGVLLWTLFGLAGSTRILRGPSGHGVLTFHLPFIVAAMVLGGPIAGGWVAFLASIERRELSGEVPWYGALANHAGLALAAIAGALLASLTTAGAAGLGVPDGSALMLVGAVVATFVFSVVSTGLSAGV